MADQDKRIADAIAREGQRLGRFIRRRVPDPGDAEDILQDVLAELVEALRMPRPIEQIGAWLFRVARNRIIDRFRSRSTQASQGPAAAGPVIDADGEVEQLEDLLPSSRAGPEAMYARRLLLEELDAALEALPQEQRDVFIAHELEGRSFRELSAQTGLSVNTLLSRKRYAVLQLRRRLQQIYLDFETSEGSES